MDEWGIILSGVFTLIGSAIGAWLAGKYAVNSVKKQLNYDKSSKRADEIKAYLKLHTLFEAQLKNCLNDAAKLIDLVNENVASQSFFQHRTLDCAKNCHQTYTQSNFEIEKLNLNAVPYEYYSDYITARELIKSIYLSFPQLITVLNATVKTDHIQTNQCYEKFCEYLYDLSLVEDNITHHSQSAEGELVLLMKEI